LNLEFKGKTVIVSGATRGIGKAIATAFLTEGAIVIGTYRSNKKAADAFKSSVDRSENLHLFPFDVANYSEVEAFYKTIENDFPVIDILINNSGIRKDSVLAMMSSEDWQSVISTNLTGCFNMSKFAIQNMMRQRYGRIIQICSPMSRLGFSGQANYAASKAGQEGMTKSMSKEVASRGITVNCLSPGFIDTELLTDLSEDQRKEYKKMVPMRRFGKTEEVANATLFLASDKAAYITGSTIDICGGV
jgi:3-oxoacyl-[acyl-carrier protein] reductase